MNVYEYNQEEPREHKIVTTIETICIDTSIFSRAIGDLAVFVESSSPDR